MEFEEEEGASMPVSPLAQYFNSSALSVTLLCVLESEIPIDDSQTLTLLRTTFLPINPRFSSIMVEDKKGERRWKRVQVNLNDHVSVPKFPEGLSPELYEDYFNDYFSKIAMDQLPQTRPLWELHLIKYPTLNAAGSIIFKLHHALGDGYSLMGALLTQVQRADNPSLPLTFPSRQSQMRQKAESGGFLRRIPRVFTGAVDSLLDFGWALLKSGLIEDCRSPVHSGKEGLDFHPMDFIKMSFSIDLLKQIKADLKATINDVIVGIIFLGTRMYMKAASPEVANANITGLVLLNTRALNGYKSVTEMLKPNAEMPWGNHFAFLHVSVPKLPDSDYSNPLNFVREAHKLIKRKRNSAGVYLTSLLLETLRKFRGSEVTAGYIRSTMQNSSMIMTNMIGPLEKISIANHPCCGFYFAGTGCPQSMVITVVSYMGKLNVVFRTEKGLIDPLKFKSSIQNAFEMMMEASGISASEA